MKFKTLVRFNSTVNTGAKSVSRQISCQGITRLNLLIQTIEAPNKEIGLSESNTQRVKKDKSELNTNKAAVPHLVQAQYEHRTAAAADAH